MLNTLGSLFFLCSFAFLWGPLPYFYFLFSENRRIVTGAYVLFVFSYIPGGERGLRFMTSMFSGLVTRQSKLVLPI
uniref:NADH dehydrogenase subunit 4 n=1 Tax=Panagrolaimus sp. JU765 TaxID=591449 RepID=A0AC34QXV2_9BILA